MTTKVTVEASGDHYPARVTKAGSEERNELVASGQKLELYCGVDDTITVTEEYYAEGYPAPAVADETEQPAAE